MPSAMAVWYAWFGHAPPTGPRGELLEFFNSLHANQGEKTSGSLNGLGDGPQRREARQTLADGAVKEFPSTWRGHQRQHCVSPGGLAANSHIAGVTAKGSNIVTYPLKRGHEIQQGGVPETSHSACRGGRDRDCPLRQAVVERHRHQAVARCECLAMIHR